MSTTEEFSLFVSHRTDGIGSLDVLVSRYGEPSSLVEYEIDDDGDPTEKTKNSYREMETTQTKASLEGRRGCVWTVYEETEDSKLTRKGRIYVRNSLAMYSYGERTKIVGWIVTPEGSGVSFKDFLVFDGKESLK